MASQLITVLAPPSNSPHATSVSCAVTVPNPTPLSEALKGEVVDPPPDIDVTAMIKLLEPIAETLNEAAEEAKYPTPPINTPTVASPPASVVYRHPRPRTRSQGISTISDRLARAKIDIHRYTHQDCDVLSNSEHSILTSSTAGDDNSESDLLSEDERDVHEIHVAIGSPRTIPIGLVSFTSNDLADRPLLPFNSATAVEGSTATADTAVGSGSQNRDSVGSLATGVTEMTTWNEEVESDLERVLQRLENLANDEYKLDTSKPFGYYYEAHLRRLLAAPNRRVPVTVVPVDMA
ncbi:hypothetical protein B5807_05347 [Epicoccum nigrum]|uniref:Uncharacterized protein n=1 Tax=Epicoccum nigrum TaxID=105696 RepID=A0A1Y2M1M5_EPING|nr:hypothetical protein B5807_05347 [Epicoccum nigrum]